MGTFKVDISHTNASGIAISRVGLITKESVRKFRVKAMQIENILHVVYAALDE